MLSDVIEHPIISEEDLKKIPQFEEEAIKREQELKEKAMKLEEIASKLENMGYIITGQAYDEDTEEYDYELYD